MKKCICFYKNKGVQLFLMGGRNTGRHVRNLSTDRDFVAGVYFLAIAKNTLYGQNYQFIFYAKNH